MWKVLIAGIVICVATLVYLDNDFMDKCVAKGHEYGYCEAQLEKL